MASSAIFFLAVLVLVVNSSVNAQETFTNPVIDGKSADPFVRLIGDHYYLLLSTRGETQLTMRKSTELTNFRNVESRVIFTVPSGFHMVWAAEMHYMDDGGLYIYFSMRELGDGHMHHVYVMKADDPKNPMGSWGPYRRMLPQWDEHTVDGTPMKHGNGKNYFIWPERDRLYVAEMLDPYTVSDQRILLREPTRPWECNVLEGPFVIYNRNMSYLVFSACYTGGPNYSLGLMSIDADKNPMNTSEWWYGDDGPVFWRNDEESVFGPGHASFTTSPDGTETWMLYHAWMDGVNFYWDNRIARAEKITWAADGKPVFPRPHGFNSPQPIPSGQRKARPTFTNPIVSGNSADPFVIRIGGFYYMLLSTRGETELTVYKSDKLTNFRNVESAVIFKVPEGHGNVWAAEMHYMMDGGLYVYFSFNKDGESHRMYAMKANDPNNPMGSWGPYQRMLPQWENHTVDGSPIKHANGKTYFVWPEQDRLYISEMTDPLTVSTNRVLLRAPQYSWECNVLEGPFAIYNRNVTYLVFSACFTGSPDYSLGLMSIDGDKNPLNISDWWYGKEDGPVFWRNDEEDVYGPGHASFTTSPDGTETWMVYHASPDRNHFWGYRIARLEKIGWGEDGKPIFPRPHGYYSPQPVPSGQLSA